jgi:hypothetical protein
VLIIKPKTLILVILTILLTFLGFLRVSKLIQGGEKMNANVVHPTISEAPIKKITIMEIVDGVNRERKAANLKILVENTKLDEAAEKKAEDMCSNHYWSHISPSGIDPWHWFRVANFNYDKAGENLGRDFNTADDMISAWMKSPEHKANILLGKYTQTGVAIKECVLNDYKTTVVVQLFANFASNLQNQNAPVESPNTPVHCPKSAECGGGTIPLKKVECENSTCCQMRDKRWVFYINKNKCTEDQKNGL